MFTTKKQFLGFTQDSLTTDQLKQLTELSIKDSSFVMRVDSTLVKQTVLISIYQMCISHIRNAKLIAEVDSIMERRNSALLGYFTNNGITAQRIKISNVKNENQATKEAIPRYLINLFHE